MDSTLTPEVCQPERLTRLTPERQALVEENVRLAYYFAYRYARRCGSSMPEDDLVGEAQFALVRAACCFNATKGVSFGSFAGIHIQYRLARATSKWRHGGRLSFILFSAMDKHHLECITAYSAADAEFEEGLEELRRQLARILPARWFSIVERHFLQGLPLKQIGAADGIGGARVAVLLQKALDRARKHLTTPI